MNKKLFVLLPVAALVAYFSLSSHTAGYTNNRTGSHGASVGCYSCHGSSATPGITVALELDSAGIPVTSYMPGGSYTVKMTGTNTTTNNLPAFGLQLSIVSGSGSSSVDAGVMSGAPTGTSIAAGFNKLLIQTMRLSPATGTGGTGTTYTVSINWTAPAAGTGTVTAYGLINAVNDDGNDNSSDKWNTGSASFTEAGATTGVINPVSATASIFPDPCSDQLNITNYTGSVRIFDMGGRTVYSGQVVERAVINSANWMPGIYVLGFEDGSSRTIIRR